MKNFVIKCLNLTLFIMFMGCSFKQVHAAEDAAKGIVEGIADAASSEGLQALSGAASCFRLAGNTYALGKDLKSCIYPSDEEQGYADEIKEKMKLLELRKAFRGCLINNKASAELGPSGIPSVCEETARMMIIEGDEAEFNRMANVFNMFNK